MRRVFKFILNFNKLVIASVMIACLAFAYLSTKLSIDASAETLLIENDPDLDAWRKISQRYISPNFLVIAYTPKTDLFDKQNLELIKNLSDELKQNSMIDGVLSILTVPLLQSVEGGLSGILKHTPTLADKDINLTKVKQEFQTSPLYSKNLISQDLKTTAIVLHLKDDEKFNSLLGKRNDFLIKEKEVGLNPKELQEFERIKGEFKRYRDELRIKEHENLEQIKATIAKFHSDEHKLFLGGANMIADDMISFVRSDLYIYGISVALLLTFSLWMFFRQIRWVVLPVFICVISVIFTTGIFGLFGWEVTVISSNYVALQLIITISTVIHLIVSYREFFIKHPNFSQKQLVYLTLRDKFSPSFWAIFTTIVGFSSLMSAEIKPVIMLGVMMSSGIAISLVVAFLLFGSVVVNLSKLPPVRTFENKFHLTKQCASLAINSRKAVYLICAFIIIFGLIGISKLRVENSFIGYFKKDTQIYQGMEVIDTQLGGTIPVDVIVTFNEAKEETKNDEKEEKDEFEDEFSQQANDAKYWFNSYHTRIAQKVHAHLLEQNFIGHVSSLGTLIKVMKDLNNGTLDDFLLSAMYSELPDKYKNILLSPYVNVEHNQLRFSMRVVDSDKNLHRDEFLKELESGVKELVKNDNVTVQVVGMMVLYNNMLQNLINSQVDTFALTILLLFLVFCFIFKSIKLAMIAITANLIPLCTLFGVMGTLGVPLDVMSITIAAISIGIGVDDIIHYVHRLREELVTKPIIQSIKASHASIGYAMYYTSFTVFLGFSVMTTSNFIPTIYFGLLTDLVMAFMLLGALVILPSLVISFSKKG